MPVPGALSWGMGQGVCAGGGAHAAIFLSGRRHGGWLAGCGWVGSGIWLVDAAVVWLAAWRRASGWGCQILLWRLVVQFKAQIWPYFSLEIYEQRQRACLVIKIWAQDSVFKFNTRLVFVALTFESCMQCLRVGCEALLSHDCVCTRPSPSTETGVDITRIRP